MSIMSHLNEQNALTSRETRSLPDGVLAKPDLLRLINDHYNQLASLFETLCHCQAYQDRLDALDECLTQTRRFQAIAEAHSTPPQLTKSRTTLIAILERWRSDIAPVAGSADTFVDMADPVDHNPADTNLAPEDCAA